MKTVHLHSGTGLRFVTCSSSELSGNYQKTNHFPIDKLGWGRKDPTNDRVRLIFDTRYIDTLSQTKNRTLPIGPQFQVVLHPISEAVSAALIIDLGNTRSFGLLLDDTDHANAMTIHQLKIVEYSRWTDTFNTTGVFASHVCLEHMQPVDHPDLLTTKDRYGRPLSGMRTGEAARSLMLQSANFPHPPNGRIAQVSPKRFFWDHDPVRFKWRASCVDEQKFVDPAGVLYDAWMEDTKTSPESMPPSTLIGAMVVEIFSQAEMQLNENPIEAGSAAEGPRRIRHISITYPPAWTKLEKVAYRDTIAKHLNAFCDERGLPNPVLRLECDEASGTLLAFISNEVEKFGGRLSDWIATVGSIDTKGNGRVRIAVLDIGGGTSDLLMADVCCLKGKFGIDDLEIKRFYQDGVLVAGDELLRIVAARIVLPAVAKAICPDDQTSRATFFNFAISQPTTDQPLRLMRSRWAQQVWFPLALQVVQFWQKNEKIVLSDDLNSGLDNFCRDCLQIISCLKLERAPFSGLGSTENPNNGKIAQHLTKLSPMPEKIEAICKEVFYEVGEQFGVPIGIANCDRVLLAGKTTDFIGVRNVLTRSISLPNYKIVSFANYRLAPRWVSSAGKDGTNILGDVKMTTVIGAALELCVQNGISDFGRMVNLQISDAYLFSESQQYWGIVPPSAVVPTFKNKDAVFTPGDGVQKQQIPIHSHSMIFARRRTKFENMTAQIAYELRLKPGFSGIPYGVVEIERVVNPDGSVELQLARIISGHLDTNGQQINLRMDHLELRQMVAQNSDFWVSEGNFYEQIEWGESKS